MQKVIISTPEELETLMRSIIKEELSKLLKELQGTKHQLMTASEVAKLYGVSRVTIYQMKKDGRLPYKYVGSRVRFQREVVMKVLESRA